MLPCFVVNLEKDIDRKVNISRQLNQLGLPFKIVNAVYGAALDKSELDEHYNNERAIREFRELVPGEIGCALSHRLIYKEIIENELPCALVLEDDALIIRSPSDGPGNSELIRVLRALENILDPNKPTVVLLNYVRSYIEKSSQELTDQHRLASITRSAYGTYAYVLTHAAAKRLHEMIYPFYLPCDHWYQYQKAHVVEVKALIPYCISMSDMGDFSNIYARDEAARQEKTVLAFFRRNMTSLMGKLFHSVKRQKRNW